MNRGSDLKAKVFAIAACTAVLCFGSLLAGCSSSSSASSESTQSAKSEPVKELMSIGAGSNEIVLTNSTGKNIVGVATKSITESAYGANLMKASDVLNADDQCKLLVNTPAGTTSNAGGANVSIKGMIDIQLTFADGTTAAVRQIDPTSITKATVKVADGLGYIEYTNSEGKTVSTLESAKAIKAQEDAAAQAQAEAAAAAQAEAQAEADAAAQAQAATTYDNSSNSSASGSGSNDYSSGSSSQGQDSCLGNINNFLK